jgi:hypothetical protein
MKDQHEKIKGYRDLSQEEIDLINEIKAVEETVADLYSKVSRIGQVRWASIARTELETGFIYLIKAIAQPTNGMGAR